MVVASQRAREMAKNFFRRLLPQIIIDVVAEPTRKHYEGLLEYATLTYSQDCEDRILHRIFNGKTDGFYVDVGAHHPKRFSNTHHFYQMGWKGINIDAAPGSTELFMQTRTRDINLQIAISDQREVVTYYIFNEAALNTLSAHLAAERNRVDGYEIIAEQKVETRRLSEVLDEYLMAGQVIDFMSIDVEGFDFRVLQSNDWTKYRPTIVLVEDLDTFPIHQMADNKVFRYLDQFDYEPVARTLNTIFFRNKQL